MASMAHDAPPLNIPKSSSTVNVHIIDTTSRIKGIPFSLMMTPEYKGLDCLDCPAYSFLIENHSTNRKVLFDLGVSKDWEQGPEVIVKRIKENGWDVTVEKDVAQILQEGGVEVRSIEAIIWSHHHWDHTGDPSLFPSTTSLVVGPGFTKAFTPGYPTYPSSPVLESAYTNRSLREISFEDSNLLLGRCPAIDYFGDGSFYLLDTPGHSVGHICALARTTAGEGKEPTFLFLGGDCAHHGGEFRPTRYLPLPEVVEPEMVPSVKRGMRGGCPGAMFSEVHRLSLDEGAKTEPFLLASEEASKDVEAARESVVKMGEFDGHDNILTIIAHDDSMLDVVDKFPHGLANDWKKKGWREKGMWRFLNDFAGAVEEKT